jgi:hypothetical protein
MEDPVENEATLVVSRNRPQLVLRLSGSCEAMLTRSPKDESTPFGVTGSDVSESTEGVVIERVAEGVGGDSHML